MRKSDVEIRSMKERLKRAAFQDRIWWLSRLESLGFNLLYGATRSLYSSTEPIQHRIQFGRFAAGTQRKARFSVVSLQLVTSHVRKHKRNRPF